VTRDRIVAVALLTSQDLELLGNTFQRLWPVDHSASFDGLLKAIDEAGRELRPPRPMPMPLAKL
jgi:hypothetical protein